MPFLRVHEYELRVQSLRLYDLQLESTTISAEKIFLTHKHTRISFTSLYLFLFLVFIYAYSYTQFPYSNKIHKTNTSKYLKFLAQVYEWIYRNFVITFEIQQPQNSSIIIIILLLLLITTNTQIQYAKTNVAKRPS